MGNWLALKNGEILKHILMINNFSIFCDIVKN